MKTTLLAGVAVAALMLAAPQASAGGYKPYVSLFGGASVLTKNPHGGSTGNPYYSFDYLINNPGYIIGGAVGVDWGNQLRTELELSRARWTSDKYHYAANTIDGTSGTNSASTVQIATYLLGNAWYDLGHGSQITPYVGGGLGIGWAHVDENNGQYLYDASGLAFQLGAGLRFNVSDHLSIDAGYRFKDIVGLNYSSPPGQQYFLTDTSLASHNFQIGLTYQF